MIGELHKDDVGTVFRLEIRDENDLVVDISSATIKNIIFGRPDGTNLIKTASFTNAGTDGLIQYTAASGDLDQAGIFRIQAFVVMGGNKWYSDIKSFKIFPNIE